LLPNIDIKLIDNISNQESKSLFLEIYNKIFSGEKEKITDIYKKCGTEGFINYINNPKLDVQNKHEL
jgi:hypothetical protein